MQCWITGRIQHSGTWSTLPITLPRHLAGIFVVALLREGATCSETGALGPFNTCICLRPLPLTWRHCIRLAQQQHGRDGTVKLWPVQLTSAKILRRQKLARPPHRSRHAGDRWTDQALCGIQWCAHVNMACLHAAQSSQCCRAAHAVRATQLQHSVWSK